MRTTKLKVSNRAGVELSAVVDEPDEIAGWVLFTHCFTCSKDLKSLRRIAHTLTEDGLAVVRFDFTGLGESGGRFEDTTFQTNIEDILDMAEFMDREFEAPTLGIGHSLGGAAFVHAAPKIPSLRGIVTMGTPFDPGEVKRHFSSALPTISTQGSAQVQLAGRPFIITREFVESLENTELSNPLSRLTVPILVIQSSDDSVVDPANGKWIFEASHEPRELVELKGTNHLMTSGNGSMEAASAIVERFEGALHQL